MATSIRSFIAIELEPPLQEALKKVQDHFRPLGLDISWVKPQNIHLTLKFLGNISPDKLDEIKALLPKLFVEEKAFKISIDAVGVFPGLRSPRVIWAGIKDNAETVKRLAAAVEEGCSPLGFEKEDREFTSHLTIGRVRSSRNALLLAPALERFTFPGPLIQTIKSVTLFQSTLTPQGPIYAPLMKVALS